MRLTRLSLILILLAGGCVGGSARAQPAVPTPARPTLEQAVESTTRPTTEPTTQPVGVSTTAPASPTTAPIALADINTQIDSAAAALKSIGGDLTPGFLNPPLVNELNALKHQLDNQFEETHLTVNSQPSVEALRALYATWAAAWEPLRDWKADLTARLAKLDQHVLRLAEMNHAWTERLAKAKGSDAPADVTERVQSLLDTISRTRVAADRGRTQIASLQNRASREFNRVNDTLISIKSAQDNVVAKLLTKDAHPVWSRDWREKAAGAFAAGQNSFTNQLNALKTYTAQTYEIILAHVAITVVIIVALFAVRRRVGKWTHDEPDLKAAFDVFCHPIATGLLLSIVVSAWLYPQAPRLMGAIVGLLMMAPTIFLLHKLLDRRFFPLLNGMAVFYAVDQARMVTASQQFVSRLLFLLEMLAGVLFVLWLIRTGQLRTMVGHLHNRIAAWVTVLLRIAGVLFLAALAMNVVGYAGLSKLIGGATLVSGYVGMVFYTAVQILDGLVMAALRLWPFTLLNMVRRHRERVHRRLTFVIRLAAGLLWAWITLDLFAVRGPVVNRATAITTATLSFGPLQLSLWNVLSFAFAVWAAFALSRVIRFLLDEDVYPRLFLPRGLPYAFSSVLHYLVLLIGFFTAVGAVGYDLTKFTILAGAFGVGLGFGLQNIVNNFVSGIILLFERPLQVGDTIEIDGQTGVVRRIGIRGSVIRTTMGSELIVPNARFISEKVTNWTFSSGQRAIQLTINAASDAEPKQVMEVLLKTAAACELVTKEPAPQVLMTGFNAGSMTFELQVWTKRYEDWKVARSDLGIAVAAALKGAGIGVR